MSDQSKDQTIDAALTELAEAMGLPPVEAVTKAKAVWLEYRHWKEGIAEYERNRAEKASLDAACSRCSADNADMAAAIASVRKGDLTPCPECGQPDKIFSDATSKPRAIH